MRMPRPSHIRKGHDVAMLVLRRQRVGVEALSKVDLQREQHSTCLAIHLAARLRRPWVGGHHRRDICSLTPSFVICLTANSQPRAPGDVALRLWRPKVNVRPHAMVFLAVIATRLPDSLHIPRRERSRAAVTI